MIAADIVNQLMIRLPQFTDKFTNDISIASITRSGTLMTVLCNSEHGLEVGDAFIITGTDTPITISSLTRAGVIGTLITAENHDLTNPVAPTIRITCATESEFNDTFTLINVDNRKTIRFTMEDSGATVATGSPLLRDAESYLRDYNSIYQVESVLNDASFTFIHSVSGLPNPMGTIIARTSPRISASIDIDRAIDAYTKHEVDEYWSFVVLGDVNASQSRQIESDAIDNQQRNVNYRQQIIEPFTVYVFIPVKNEIAAADARDEASILFRSITRSLLFSKFDTELPVASD